MLRAALAGIRAHLLRFAATTFAVVIGVGFVAGTFVFTDTINRTFDELFEDAYAGVAVVVQPERQFAELSGGAASMPETVLDDLADIEGIEAMRGSVIGTATIIAPDGTAVLPQGPPTLGFSWDGNEEVGGFRMRAGESPARAGEVAVDSGSSSRHDISVGDEVTVVFPDDRGTFRVSGIVEFGRADNLGGATIAVFTLPTAQRYFGLEGQLNAIFVAARPGVDHPQLREAVAERLPDGVEAVLGAEAASDEAENIAEFFGIVQSVLLGFAFVAMFVGSFIIYNTFAIVVAQRIREFALLRAIGATRRQVGGAIMVEATAVGLIASALGIVAGLGLAIALRELIEAFGGQLPQTDLVLQQRTVAVAFALGVGVTVLAALVPAIRGTRVPPVAAMRVDATAAPSEQGSRVRLWLGAAAAAGAGILAWLGIRADSGLLGAQLVGAAAVAAILMFVLVGPVLVRVLVPAIGLLLARPWGVAGRAAVANAIRSPQRTVATASALMIGVAIVVLTVLMSGSIDRTVRAQLDDTLRADLAVGRFDGPPAGFSTAVARELAAVEGVDRVASIRFNQFRLPGDDSIRILDGIDPEAIQGLFDLPMVEGSERSLRPGRILLDRQVTERRGLAIGDGITLRFPAGDEVEFEVAGIYESGAGLENYIIHMQDYEQLYSEQLDGLVLASVASGMDVDEVAERAREVLLDYPVVEVRTQSELRDTFLEQIDQLLLLVLALLLLSVVIALLGIVNTLGLSVLERTREIGLLRAVGATRRQVAGSIGVESVLVAVYGSIIGVVLGLAAGWALVEALGSVGFVGAGIPRGVVLDIPAGVIVEVLVVGIVAGVLAALLPALRAARLDVLRAISRG